MDASPPVFDAIVVGKIGKPDINGAVLFEAICLKDHRELSLKRDHPVFFIVPNHLAQRFRPQTIYRIPVVRTEAFYRNAADGASYCALMCGKPRRITNAVILTESVVPLPAKAAAVSETVSLSAQAQSPPPINGRRKPFPFRWPHRIGTHNGRFIRKNKPYDFVS